MIRTTPFHERLSALNTQGLYTHWQGRLSALRYSSAPKHEYFAVRNSVGIFDTSPLYSYRVQGPDAERLLAGVLTRDPRSCRPGRAAYTVWCDDRGFVMQDGVLQRRSATDFTLTTARPSLGWLERHRGRLRVDLRDVSDDVGILAVQGPRSRAALAGLLPVVESLGYFEHAEARLDGTPVTVSRTGFTGDLGFELTVPAPAALDVLDRVLAAGRVHGMRPFGEEALMMLRIEAGLPLVDVEWHDSSTATSDHDRVTPPELGLGWMLGGPDDRPFVGRDAIRAELRDGTSRWSSVGVLVDWQAWDRLHRDAGVLPPKDERPLQHESLLRDPADPDGEAVGFVTSLLYSPVLQRHVGLARVLPDLAAPGTLLDLEVSLHHRTATVAARTAALPLFDPARKKARP